MILLAPVEKTKNYEDYIGKLYLMHINVQSVLLIALQLQWPSIL